MSFSNCKDTKKYWFTNSKCLLTGIFYSKLLEICLRLAHLLAWFYVWVTAFAVVEGR